MTTIGRLTDVPPRTAWNDEARDFTPWLAEHVDELGDVLGLRLEIEDTEVAVESFSADIVARNTVDDTLVLIENQLETTDHRHLGQIMTYLAGVGAQVIVWIATDFREPHLAAIKWLNEHTVEPYAFFAVKLRVVRIADSPLAPVFDVVERPNEWERRTQAAIRESTGELSERGEFRRAFWSAYLERHPDDARLGLIVGAASSNWIEVEPGGRFNIALFTAKTMVGLFVRGERGSDGEWLASRLSPHVERLEERLGANHGRKTGGFFFTKQHRADMTDRANWPAAIDWLHDEAHRYRTALTEELGLENRP